MGKYQSPMVKHDLARLEKGPDIRRSAMLSLKAYVEQLDQGSMPRFLQQVSDTRDSNDSRSHAISLYEDVARVHGRLVIPHLPRIMNTVVKSLSNSGSSIHLQEACSKVVASIARYTIEPISSVTEIDEIFRTLCNPLMDVLVGKLEPLAAGAAVCLQALVESEKWKYAPEVLVTELANKITNALKEKPAQTLPHMQLAKSVAKHSLKNNQECGLPLLKSAKEIIDSAGSWHHRGAAVSLLQTVMIAMERDPLLPELGPIMDVLEKHRLDRMPHVRTEVTRTLQVAKILSSGDEFQIALLQDSGARSLLLDGFDSKKSSRRRSFDGSRHGILGSMEDANTLKHQRSQESEIISSPPPMSSSSEENQLFSAGKPLLALAGSKSVSPTSSSDDSDFFFSATRTLNAMGDAPLWRAESYAKESSSGRDAEASPSMHVKARLSGLESDLLADAGHGSDTNAFDDLTPSMPEPLCKEFRRSRLPRASLSNQSPQSPNLYLTPEDLLRFTTPRRLVRSLQSGCSTPDTGEGVVDQDCNQGEERVRFTDMELEARSEAEWSVRDNPIAEDSDGGSDKECEASGFHEGKSFANEIDDLHDSKMDLTRLLAKSSTSFYQTDAISLREDVSDTECSSITVEMEKCDGQESIQPTTDILCYSKPDSNDNIQQHPAFLERLEMPQSGANGEVIVFYGNKVGTTVLINRPKLDHKDFKLTSEDEDDTFIQKDVANVSIIRHVGNHLRRVKSCAEIVLGGSACAVVSFSVAMVITSFFGRNLPDMVPT